MKSKVDRLNVAEGVTENLSITTMSPTYTESTKLSSRESSKTIIKRPKKLQQTKDASKVVVYKGRVEIIRLIFFPIRDILTKLLGPVVGNTKIMAVTDSIRSPKKHTSTVDQFDGIDSLVPTQAFLCLAVLCRISINTNLQRQVYYDAMQLCLLYKLSLSSSLRAAVMFALCAALDSWSHMKNRKFSSFGTNAGSGLIGQVSDIEVQDDTLAMSVADFASQAIKDESNQACRDALSGILRCAIETFEMGK